MRTIKFRAWDKFKKAMNYKVLAGNTDMEDDNYTCNLIWVQEKKEWMNADGACINLMQFTGLKDRHGIGIYEGDILGGYPHGTALVRWCSEFACFESYAEDGDTILLATDLENCKDAWEVLGNIHENPELFNLELIDEDGAIINF